MTSSFLSQVRVRRQLRLRHPINCFTRRVSTVRQGLDGWWDLYSLLPVGATSVQAIDLHVF